MSALSPEARARLRDWLARYQSCADSEHMRIPGDDSPWGPTFGDLRALLADSDALAASEAADRAVVVAMEAAKAALETVTRERDEVREFATKANAEWRRCEEGWRAVWHDREAFRAQVAKLREALERWLPKKKAGVWQHGFGCPAEDATGNHPCTCGAWTLIDADAELLRSTAPEPREDGGSDNG